MCVCVHVDFLFFFLPEMVNKVEYIYGKANDAGCNTCLRSETR